ncbi:MAG TPA: carboxymuconolactone decarboxylase family protein [Candidatus Elarobacter sp.]|jgi:alkylhydroperoxidase family enzyme
MNVSIPMPSDDVLSHVIGDDYNPERVLNVIKMFAGTDDLYKATIGLVNALFRARGIDPKAREMIILRSASILNVPYEAQANRQMAANAGLSNAEIAAAAQNGPVHGINPDYVLLCKATDELSLTATLTDDTLTEMLARYDETVCRKFVLLIAWFNLLSRFLNGCRVPLETTDKIGSRTSPI